VLVVIYCTDAPVEGGEPSKGEFEAKALLIERADHPGFWQSVTGSLDAEDEPLRATCRREVEEETGIVASEADFEDLELTNIYSIYPHWQKRYAPGVVENTEHVYALRVPFSTYASKIVLSPDEHLRYQWLPIEKAAMTCFSWTNAKAIKALQARL
jgi:dihydroneopterin triphosphate diphosphatase